MCDAFVEVGEPMRPSTVPPTTCEPFLRRARRMRFGAKRSGRGETLSKGGNAPFFARVMRTCSRPPDFLASGRVGCANRRSRSTACATGWESLAATRDFLAFLATFLVATAFAEVAVLTWRPALAGAVGFGSLPFWSAFAWIAFAVVFSLPRSLFGIG